MTAPLHRWEFRLPRADPDTVNGRLEERAGAASSSLRGPGAGEVPATPPCVSRVIFNRAIERGRRLRPALMRLAHGLRVLLWDSRSVERFLALPRFETREEEMPVGALVSARQNHLALLNFPERGNSFATERANLVLRIGTGGQRAACVVGSSSGARAAS